MFLFDITKIVHPSSLMDYHHFLHHSMALAWREDHLFSANPCRVVDYLIRFMFFPRSTQMLHWSTVDQIIDLMLRSLANEIAVCRDLHGSENLLCPHTHIYSNTYILSYTQILIFIYIYIYVVKMK